ncbi:metallothiol transferase FosB [Clostridium sp. 'deep sea']|uniref:metallothiol transferase FosB n=1 Tax=Clostridium sp. 'deep sea' TaxID=2779445 RepID=UPI00189648CC|nr:metallothiol transferase FosB [Clostridium sp. 'deep sea']QOR35494.1 metallothiol transferase FosB [Clostridium sp. 'deep sea']
MELSINHLTFSVSNLQLAVNFYQNVFNAKLLVLGDKLAYFDLNGIWLALNLEQDIPRNEIYQSYTHISFSITEQEYPIMLKKLQDLRINIIESRVRHDNEGKSIYFRDPDGHLFELHTKTKEDRINFYKQHRLELRFFE